MSSIPPVKTVNPDGTISLVPVPPARVLTPYIIDPSFKYRMFLESGWANKSWNGGIKNGSIACRGDIIYASIMAMPIPMPVVQTIWNGTPMNVYKWSIFRGIDAIVQYDHERLELLPASQAHMSIDTSVMNIKKTWIASTGDGIAHFHSEVLDEPQLRVPPQKPSPYQWNFNGYMWQGGYRIIGRIGFKVKDDYYLPEPGAQRSFIRLVQSSSIDGSPIPGTNVLSEIRSEGEDIMFGAPASYKVSHVLSAPVSAFRPGDVVPVEISVTPETKPQIIHSVSTNFSWNPAHLEFIGVDQTTRLAGSENGLSRPGPGKVNESAIPKDGTGWHNWFSVPGVYTIIKEKTVIANLMFRVVSDFDSTSVSIVNRENPILSGQTVLSDSGVVGSSIPGSYVHGVTSDATITGSLG